jgi:hypothetical protein
MQLLRTLVRAAALTLLFAGCQSTPSVFSDAKPGQDFAAYRRFALLPLSAVENPSDPGLMLRISEPARKTVVEALVAKGFAEVERAQADFTVSVRGHAIPRTEVTELGYSHGAFGRGYMYPASHDVDVYNYEERTLAVEVYDEKSKEQVWVGWFTIEGTGRIEAQRVCEGLRLILAQFPPTAPGGS